MFLFQPLHAFFQISQHVGKGGVIDPVVELVRVGDQVVQLAGSRLALIFDQLMRRSADGLHGGQSLFSHVVIKVIEKLVAESIGQAILVLEQLVPAFSIHGGRHLRSAPIQHGRGNIDPKHHVLFFSAGRHMPGIFHDHGNAHDMFIGIVLFNQAEFAK